MGAPQVRRAPAAVAGAMRRVVAPIRGRRGRLHDPNFIGFDKYRRDGAYHWTELQRRAEYRDKIELVGTYARPTDRCLDIGCGDGAYAYALSAHVAAVTGIDADHEAVRLARRELRRHAVGNVACHQIAIGDLTLESVGVSAPFDLVYSMDVIEHLPVPEQLLERAVEVARPGGRILVGTPRYLGDDLVSTYHVREFGTDELVDIVAANFAVDEVHLLPMTRLSRSTGDETLRDDGFVVVVGTAR